MLFHTDLCLRWVRRLTRSVCKGRCATCPSRDGNWLAACVVATAECQAGKSSTRPRRRHRCYRGYKSTPHVFSTTNTTAIGPLRGNRNGHVLYAWTYTIGSPIRSAKNDVIDVGTVENLRVGMASNGTTWKHCVFNSNRFTGNYQKTKTVSWNDQSSMYTQKLLLL